MNLFAQIFFLISFTLFSGCDIFSTRIPEKPSQTISSFIQPTTAEIVLVNFKNAIEEYNVDNYIKCFVDPNFSEQKFKFVASVEAGIDRTIFEDWSLESERQYITNLGKPPFTSAKLILTPKGETVVTTDSVIYNFDYSLDYPHINQNYNVIGNLRFYIGADRNRNWSVYKWEDYKTTSSMTWSYLKAVFSTGL